MHKENCTFGLESGRGLNMDMISTTVGAVDVLRGFDSLVPFTPHPPQTKGLEPANDSSCNSRRKRRVFVVDTGGASGGET